MRRRSSWPVLIAAGVLTLGALTMPAQTPAPAPAGVVKADAEFSRKAYDTYRTMVQSSPYRQPAVAIPWPDQHQRTRHRHRRGRRERRAEHLRRVCDQRRLEDRRRRRDVAGRVRESAVDQHRRHRRRAVESGHRVGRAPASRTCFAPRCRASAIFKSTDGGRTFQHTGLADTQTIARIVVSPDQSEHRLCRVGRPCLDGQRDARRVQDDRRRADVDQGALSQPAYRRDRSGHGSRRIRTRSTQRCGSACGASGAIRGSSRATTRSGICEDD